MSDWRRCERQRGETGGCVLIPPESGKENMVKRWMRKAGCNLRSGSFLILGSALLWGGCALSMQGQTAAPDTLLRDHATSAVHYREQAAQARKAAEAHEVMLLLYRGEGDKAGSGPSLSEQSLLVKHCERVVQSFRDAAESLEALAQEHDERAGASLPSLFINRGGGP